MANPSQVGERASAPLDKNWVDFKAVKQKVSMKMVLDHYHIENLKPSPTGELRGPCPIHRGTGLQFSVNTSKNAFQCFYSSCKAKGNVLDFVAAMEQCSVRGAALKLSEWFEIGERETGKANMQPRQNTLQQGIYKHYKGNDYLVMGVAIHSETEESLVVYRALYGDYRLTVRPLSMFTESVIVDGEPRPRFHLIHPLES